MRNAWAETLAERLWEENIKVQVRGTGHSTLRSVGGTFANNKSIKQFQEGLFETLIGLRFKRAEYLWIPSADNYTYYTLKTPSDAEILLTAPK